MDFEPDPIGPERDIHQSDGNTLVVLGHENPLYTRDYADVTERSEFTLYRDYRRVKEKLL